MASNAESSSPGPSTAEEWKDTLKNLLVDSGAVEDTRERLPTMGTYAEGSVLKAAGVTYIGKTILTSMFATDNFRKQFTEKCLELSRLRHPHLVQLIGVQLSDSGAVPPVLLFEHQPLSLSSCLRKYSHIPEHASYSILLEVSLGLRFLHEQKPPLVHGHLNANNVLLTEALHAKISDVVRFGAPTPSQPNAPYNPPENSPSESGDIFNFGDLILQISIQREPSPLKEKKVAKEAEAEEEVTLSEVERREKFFGELGETHPLRELASNCLQDEPSSRPAAAGVSQEMEVVTSKHPREHQNILDMFAIVGQLTLTKETVASLNRELEAKQEEIEGLKEQIEPLKLELESKDQVLAAEKQEVEAYKQALSSKEGRIKAYETGLRAKEALAKAKDREIAAKKQDLAAKDNLLKAAHNRIEVLENQVSSSKKKMIYPPQFSQSPSPAPSDGGSSPKATADDSSGVLLRKNKGRLGRGNISSDGYMYQGYRIQRSRSMNQGDDSSSGGGRDPILAKIFARQQQKITDAESLDSIREKKGAGSTEAAAEGQGDVSKEAKSQSSSEPTPELKRILDKRKSFLDDDEN